MDVFTNLKDSLLFFHVKELRELATTLSLLEKGAKKQVIFRICHFLKTGEKLTEPKFPAISCKERGKNYPLEEDTLMLKGAYKNDLKTRLFFKELIGPHFHFTAFGIDWLNDRWLEGNPPTYLEFATMWKKEQTEREKSPVSPKEEWAYINFMQEFIKEQPNASKSLAHAAWQAKREEQKVQAFALIERIKREL